MLKEQNLIFCSFRYNCCSYRNYCLFVIITPFFNKSKYNSQVLNYFIISKISSSGVEESQRTSISPFLPTIIPVTATIVSKRAENQILLF